MSIIDQAIDSINALFPDRTDASQPRIGAGALRTGFQAVLSAVRTRLDELLASLAITRSIVTVPDESPGAPAYFHLRVAQLAKSDAGRWDLLGLRLVMGSWGAAPRGVLSVTMGNRDGLRCQYQQSDDLADCAIVVYQGTDGISTVYVRYPNTFRSGSLTITDNVQATVFPSWDLMQPTGKIVFDSTDKVTYPTSLLQSGTGKPFQITDQKAGSNLSVDPTKYLEFIQADGTVIKLAVLNT